MKRVHLLVASVSLAFASPALADIQIIQGGEPGNLETVQLDGADLGSTLIGTVNPDDTMVLIESEEGIVGFAQGQARVEADDGNLGTLAISLKNLGLGFARAEFIVNSSADGPVSIVAYDQFGTAFGTGVNGGLAYTVDSSGNNFFNFTTSNSQLITRIEFASSTAIADIRQIRIDGIAAIPEPGTWALMIMGFGGAGAMLRRRKASIA